MQTYATPNLFGMRIRIAENDVETLRMKSSARDGLSVAAITFGLPFPGQNF